MAKRNRRASRHRGGAEEQGGATHIVEPRPSNDRERDRGEGEQRRAEPEQNIAHALRSPVREAGE